MESTHVHSATLRRWDQAAETKSVQNSDFDLQYIIVSEKEQVKATLSVYTSIKTKTR